MKRQLFFLFMLLGAVFVEAQNNNPITVTYDRTDRGDVTFWAENTMYTPCTVTISFTKLTNTTSIVEGESKDILVGYGKRELITLRPALPNNSVGFSYRTLSRKGDIHARVDTNYVYLLPIPAGKTVRMNRMVSVESLVKKKESQRVTGVAFKTNDGDTITAARGGLVTDVQDHSASTAEKKSFNATENYVEVYHKDGSFARYKLFRNGGIFVTPGDEIIPGQPMGIIGGSNYNQGSHLRFSIYSPSLERYSFFPSFYLGGEKTGRPVDRELYVAEHPKEFVMQEMSKKEKKRYLGK